MKEGHRAQGTGHRKTKSKKTGISIPVKVVSKDLKSQISNLKSFSDHHQVQALGPIMAARPNAFRDTMMRDIVLVPRATSSKMKFPSSKEMKQSLGDQITRSVVDTKPFSIPQKIQEALPHEAIRLAIPASWIRSASRISNDRFCPATASLARLAVSPEMQLHGIRHAYAHIGGWSSLDADDQLKIAYAVNERLASSNRIRFAHVERLAHHAEQIREYWAELLAFALGVAAGNEAEWRRIFLARAIQRSAGAPLAYPTSETGEKDLELIRWYTTRADMAAPWKFASQANEWIQDSEKEDRALRVRHAISGFPPGRLRMIFSVLIDAPYHFVDADNVMRRFQMSVPPNMATWVEQACVFADQLAGMISDQEDPALFGDSATISAALERFGEQDRRRAIAIVHEYIESLVNAV